MNFQICLSILSDMNHRNGFKHFSKRFLIYQCQIFESRNNLTHFRSDCLRSWLFAYLLREISASEWRESDAHLRSDEQARTYFLILLFFFTCSGQLKSDLVSYSLWLIEWQTFDVKICWLVPQDFNNETIGFFPICIACFLFCFWVKKHFTSLCVWSVALDSINKKMMRFSSFLINWMKWYDHLLCFHTSC